MFTQTSANATVAFASMLYVMLTSWTLTHTVLQRIETSLATHPLIHLTRSRCVQRGQRTGLPSDDTQWEESSSSLRP